MLLSDISNSYGLTKTEVVEKAVAEFAKKYKRNVHPLAKFAGIWADEDVESMLKTIRKSKTNKNIKVDL